MGKERRSQIERAQKICTTLMTTAQQIMRDCEARPPANEGLLETLDKCRENLAKTRDALIEISVEMETLKPLAWDSGDE